MTKPLAEGRPEKGKRITAMIPGEEKKKNTTIRLFWKEKQNPRPSSGSLSTNCRGGGGGIPNTLCGGNGGQSAEKNTMIKKKANEQKKCGPMNAGGPDSPLGADPVDDEKVFGGAWLSTKTPSSPIPTVATEGAACPPQCSKKGETTSCGRGICEPTYTTC